MTGNPWEPIAIERYEEVWAPFDARFRFRPRYSNPGPAIDEPTPSVTFDLRPIYAGPEAAFAAGHDAANALALLAMTKAFPDGERLVVLDWQHDSWWFRPHIQAVAGHRPWPVSVFPDGDYYAFLTEDYREGTFGHPWEQTLCVFGARLLPQLTPLLASWLPVRREKV